MKKNAASTVLSILTVLAVLFGAFCVTDNAALAEENSVTEILEAETWKQADEIKELIFVQDGKEEDAGKIDKQKEILQNLLTGNGGNKPAETEAGGPPESYTFNGIPWGTPATQVSDMLPAGAKLDPFSGITSFRSVPGFLYMGDETMYKGPIGYRSYGAGGSLDVEGYKVDTLFLYCIKVPDKNGKLTDDLSQSAFFEAYYVLKPDNVGEAYENLLGIMRGRYGDETEQHGSGSKLCYIWQGKDGSLFALQQDSDNIKLKYVAGNAEELLTTAYQDYKNPGSVKPKEEQKKTETVELPESSGKFLGTWKFSKVRSAGITVTAETLAQYGEEVYGECIIGEKSGILDVNLNGDKLGGTFTCEFKEDKLIVTDTNGIQEELTINEEGELVYSNSSEDALFFVKVE